MVARENKNCKMELEGLVDTHPRNSALNNYD